jgi:hypothetical protein
MQLVPTFRRQLLPISWRNSNLLQFPKADRALEPLPYLGAIKQLHRVPWHPKMLLAKSYRLVLMQSNLHYCRWNSVVHQSLLSKKEYQLQ